jgi:hypothetical protein
VAQVRAEIQQHYDAACETGETGDAAIAALGDPRVANRAYRKVLLTEREAMMAPVLTKPKRPGLPRLLPFSALMAAFAAWVLSRGIHNPGFWPIMFAMYSTGLVTWCYPPTTLERCRVYTYVLGVRSILIVSVVWWYDGWIVALPLGAVVFGVDYFFHHQRLSIFRKLASGQTYSLLPEEPRLTHVEAITLSTLSKGEPYENVSSTVLLLMVVGMAVWQPATFVPMAAWVVAAHLTRRSIPFRTEEGSRWFRLAKWTAMVVAALLPVLYGARKPWIGAPFLAFIFVLFDMRSISIRRKLPVAQWPKRLYW